MEHRTFVDEHRYIFTTDVEHGDLRAFVTVHWAGLTFAPDDSFLRPLRSYLDPRHEVAEVWFIYPADLDPLHVTLQAVDRFPKVDESGAPRKYRFFSVDKDGHLDEQRAESDSEEVTVTAEVASFVIADGLRQLFRDTDALASATAGFHFTHPGGSHSAHFIRTSQAVSRVQHCYFVAMALLGLLPRRGDRTIWVDTAGIAPVAYAYIDLLRRYRLRRPARAETFTGHGGLTDTLRPGAHDLALISGSTSGTLARRVIKEKNLPAANVATLFYLGAATLPPSDGHVLCDLTNRDEEVTPSVRDARIAPYITTKRASCALCATGSGEIVLDGDSFFPIAGALDLRMPGLYDRPLNGVRKRDDASQFDGQNYFEDLFGHNAIAFDSGSGLEPSTHGVSTRLSHLLEPGAPPVPAGRIASALDVAVEGVPSVTVVLSLADTDSSAVGAFAAQRVLGEAAAEVSAPAGMHWRVWRADGQDGLSGLTPDSTILICAGVVGSGRQLTAVSRELRQVKGGFETRYFVGVAHPESSTTWTILEQTLGRASSSKVSRLTPTWTLPREPRSPGSESPWTRETDQLRRIGGWLSRYSAYSSSIPALETRLQQLDALTDNTLFVGATASDRDVEMPPINPRFALWPFEWGTHEQAPAGAVPTHAEIYATIAHLLYESRRLSPQIDKRTITARRHGFALHPAIFDRLNDPVIQAAVLRAAEPGELHFDLDHDASRAVGDLLVFVLANLTTQAGNAAYEFLLAMCEGLHTERSYGLRVDDGTRERVLGDARALYGEDFADAQDTAPRIRALLLFLRGS